MTSDLDADMVTGRIALGQDWSIELPEAFKRRVDEGDLALWRPGMTVWIAVWGCGDADSADQLLASLQNDVDPAASSRREWENDDVLFFSYRLLEESDDDRVAALYGFAVADGGYVQFAAYFDDETDCAEAEALLRSVEWLGGEDWD